jgi:peptidoglycan glycosyltransferase
MNRPIRTLAIGCLVLFLALLVNVTYIQGWKADHLNAESQNTRARNADCSRKRGPILVNGESIARSVASHDSLKYVRTYPAGKVYAPVTGRFSCEALTTGIEQSQNSVLSGSDQSLFVSRVIDTFSNKTPQGGSVLLTINPKAQKAAYDGLQAISGNAQGAVVALDPQTGAVLAMVSTPSYNPNVLAGHDFRQVVRNYKSLVADKTQPLSNRTTDLRLPPGSTFKLVVAAAALQHGYAPTTTVKGGAKLDIPQTTHDMTNENGGNCGGDKITLTQALAVSCNVSFADIGLKLRAKDPSIVAQQAARFGFGETYLADLPMARSVYPSATDVPQAAQASIGQFDVAATPLQMAMIASAIANHGMLMKPYLVAEARSPDLKLLSKAPIETLHQSMSQESADQLTQMMVSVVQDGTGRPVQIPGISVAAKTGTANSAPDRPPYAWFVAFAPADHPQVAVAVLVQQSSTNRGEIAGSTLAGPVAVNVIKAVVER